MNTCWFFLGIKIDNWLCCSPAQKMCTYGEDWILQSRIQETNTTRCTVISDNPFISSCHVDVIDL